MLLVGLEQTLPELAQQLKKISPITLSLTFSFILFPILSWGIGSLFFILPHGIGVAAIPRGLLAGFVVLGAVPTTLTSAVIYTRLGKGNTRLALVVVLISQVLCVVVTPLLVTFFMDIVSVGTLREAPLLDLGRMILQLFLYFLLPLSIGMLLARFLPLEKLKPYLMRPEQLVVASFVFMGAGHIPPATPWSVIGMTVLAVILIQAIYALCVRFAIKAYPAEDQTALYFTTTQKTLSVGLYLLLSYFPSAAVLPMVLYHLAQLTIGKMYWRPQES